MNQQRPGSAPDADLLADMGDYPELHTLLAELRDLGQGPAPEPSPELAAFFKPKVVPLRRKRRGAVIGVVVAASMSLGVGAVAANEEVRENLYAAVDTAVELVQPDELEASNQANDGGASDNALPALPPVVAMPGGADIPAGAGQRVERPGGPVKAAVKEHGSQGDKEPGTQRGKSSSAAAPAQDPAGPTAAGQGQASEKAKANDKAHGAPKANKPDSKPHLPADEVVRNAAPKAAPHAGKAQQPAKRLVRRAVEGAPLVNKGQDNRAPGQAEDKGSGAAEKQSGPVEKIVEKGVDPAVERLGRTLGNVVDRD
ncbi:hypothetical protein [Arthrobacter crystallopoietes]|uniref:Uncharacterized protein n=1 Tax=Crystallibacter crystallopoietes TaxID=37928 RepID=A0A1H1CAM8_9MICC|nr:hypothetical protein [Arthrobacter crystallopoietes]AUI50828.1 hypothetical protein AC20117_08345 [Arthrobacter crystallopoietes]SDQ60706.1 hypothetical protein SAMN04489742_1805 [Arthrobacter crystallopoietes]